MHDSRTNERLACRACINPKPKASGLASHVATNPKKNENLAFRACTTPTAASVSHLAPARIQNRRRVSHLHTLANDKVQQSGVTMPPHFGDNRPNVYVHMCVHLYVCVYVYACVYVYVYLYLYVCVCVYVYVYAYVSVYVHVFVHMYMHVYMCMCVYVYVFYVY